LGEARPRLAVEPDLDRERAALFLSATGEDLSEGHSGSASRL